VLINTSLLGNVTSYFTENVIDGEFKFQDLDLEYCRNFPWINNVSGEGKFSREGMLINITKGKMLDSKVMGAKVYVPFDLKGKVVVTAKATGLAHNLIEFIANEDIKALDEFVPHKDMTGLATTEVKIEIPFLSDISYGDLDFDIKAKLQGVGVHTQAISFSSGMADIVFNGKTLKLKGQGLLNEKRADLKFLANISKDLHITSDFAVKTILSPLTMGIKDLSVTQGQIALDINIKNFRDITVKSNLTNTAFALPNFNFKKPSGVEALLSLSAVFNKRNKELYISKIEAKGEGLAVDGKAALVLAPFKVRKLEFGNLRFGNNDLQVNYHCENFICHTDIMANRLDLSKFDFDPLIKGSGREGSNVKLKIKTALMKNGVFFVDVLGQFNCALQTRIKCSHASLSANIGNNYFMKLAMQPNLGSQTESWLLESDNAGLVSNGFNIYKKVKDGHLNLKLLRSFSGASLANSTVTGSIAVRKFLATKTSVLVKIASLSLASFVDSSSSNILFNSFDAKFTLDGSVLSINHGVADSNYLSLTMDGDFDTSENSLNLRGSITPAIYGINKLLGNIPILGKILLGGSNQGIISANYKITGSFDKPQTSINPLSLFTPGFLRRIFDTGSTPVRVKKPPVVVDKK
jgi:hypothetical protein